MLRAQPAAERGFYSNTVPALQGAYYRVAAAGESLELLTHVSPSVFISAHCIQHPFCSAELLMSADLPEKLIAGS